MRRIVTCILLMAAVLGIKAQDDPEYKMEIGGGAVTNFNEAAMGAITLAMATAYSSNTVFAQLGVDIADQTSSSVTERFKKTYGHALEVAGKNVNISI